MRYSDIQAFLTVALTALDYSPLPVINPGPPTVATLQKITPQGLVFATLGNGAGLNGEQLFDQPFITVRVLGRQNDFTYAESLAYDIDKALLAVAGNTIVGTARTLYITRTGGSPQLVDYDASNRYHFQTTYVALTQTGI